MRVGWKETIALSPGCARSRLPWSRPVQGLGRPRDFLVAGGLDVSLAECLFEPIAARRQQCRVGLRFPVYLAYFFEVLGLQSVDPSLDVLDVLRSGTGDPAGPKEPGREGRGTARRGEGQDFDCCGRRHGMAISTMFRRARVLGPGTVLPSIRRRASRLTSLSLTGRQFNCSTLTLMWRFLLGESCRCTCPWMFTQPGGSPSRLPTPFPSMPASCAAFDCRGRAPTMSVAAGCASVTGRPPPPRPECS